MAEIGRPSDYNDALVDLFCERIATSERGVCRICDEDDDMPHEATIYRWLAKHPSFREKYARAKEMQALPIVERMRDVAADGRNDWMQRLAFKGANPSWEPCGEHINRSRLRVDTDKWLLSKLLPKQYGDRQQVDLTVTEGIAETIRAKRQARREKSDS